MELIERSNPRYLQNFVSAPVSTLNDSSRLDDIKRLIILNFLSRYKNSLTEQLDSDNISESEINERVFPRVSIRIVKLIPSTSSQGVLVGTLDKGISPEGSEDRELSSEVTRLFSDLGVNYTSPSILKSKLRDVSFSEEDPFKLTNLHTECVYEGSLSELSFSDLDDVDYLYEDTLYSDDKSIHFERVKSIAILAISEVIDRGDKSKLNDQVLLHLLTDVDDDNYKRMILKDLKQYRDRPELREGMKGAANNNLRMNPKKDKNGKPIATWKLVVALLAVLLAALAYTQRHAIEASWKLAKDAKEFNRSKFNLFFNGLFTPEGRSLSRDWVRYKKDQDESSSYLRGMDSFKKTQEARLSTAQYNLNELKNKFGRL